MDNFEQLLQKYLDNDDDANAVYLCHHYNSVIRSEDNFDKHQCKDRITCPGCYDIFHTPECYADHTCTNEGTRQDYMSSLLQSLQYFGRQCRSSVCETSSTRVQR